MSVRRIEDLCLEMQELFTKFKEGMDKAEIPFIMTCTYRSKEEQNALYAQGRTIPGKIVTWTKNSKHCITDEHGQPSSHAFDIAILVEGKPNWDCKDLYDRAAEIGRGVGIQPGKDFGDFPHFQIEKYVKKGV